MGKRSEREAQKIKAAFISQVDQSLAETPSDDPEFGLVLTDLFAEALCAQTRMVEEFADAVVEHPSWAVTGYDELESDPLLADADARMRGHKAFDRIWICSQTYKGKQRARSACYAWLAEQLGLRADECHFKLFDRAMCERAIALCENMDQKKLRKWQRDRKNT